MIFKATLPKVLKAIEKVRSVSEARRLVISGDVFVNGVLIVDITEEILIKTGDIIKVGKTEIVVPDNINGDTCDTSCDASCN